MWVWSKPIVTNHEGKDLKVLVIDSEGIGAINEDANHDTRIFLLALLISSYFIYNSMGTIDENALQNISLIVNLSREIQVKERESSSDTDEMPKYFPSFLWVVRDFTLRLVDTMGQSITSKEYLEKALELQKGTSDAVENKNKIRRMIKHFFTERDCVTLVRPIENEKQLQKLASLPESELRPEFLAQLKSIQNKIRKRVKPKMLNGKILNGNMLLELCRSYVHAINKGSVPCIESAWTYVLKYESEKLIKKLVCEYKSFINDLLPKKSQESLIGILNQLHDEIAPTLVEKFQSTALNDEVKNQEQSLISALEEAYKDFFHHIEIKEQNLSQAYLKTNLESLDRNLRKGDYESMAEFNKDLKILQDQFLHRFPNFSRDTSQSLWRTATDKVVYRAGDYITRTISDKAKNESILLQAQLESSKQKAQKLNSELEQEKNQKAKHMKEVEKKNATLKLTVKMLEEKFNLAEKSKQGEIDKVKNQMQEDQQNFDSQIDELKADYDRVRQENDILRTEKRALEGNSSIIIYS